MINIPDVYPDDEIDQTAYCILLRVQEMDASWKREIYRQLNDWRTKDRCPINVQDEVSLQTVCRRVDTLEADGLLEEQPVYSDKTGQYMEMYRLTDEAEQVIERVTEKIVRNLVKAYVEHSIDDEDFVLADGLFEKLDRNNHTTVSDPEDLRSIAEQNVEDAAAIQVK